MVDVNKHNKAADDAKSLNSPDLDREFIVAEVSTNWPKQWPVARSDYLGAKFEEVINFNLARGYRLHSFQVSQVVVEPGKMTETIIAVFERITSE